MYPEEAEYACAPRRVRVVFGLLQHFLQSIGSSLKTASIDFCLIDDSLLLSECQSPPQIRVC